MKVSPIRIVLCLTICLTFVNLLNAQQPPPPPPAAAPTFSAVPPPPPAVAPPVSSAPEPAPQPAQTAPRDQAKEELIRQDLQKIAPKAVETFKAGTIALDQKNYPEVIKLYSEVLKQAPNFEPALRRLGSVLVATGKRQEGLALTQKAVDLNRSPYNLVTQATALTDLETGRHQPTPAELKQAISLVKEAMQKDTENEAEYPLLTAQFALGAEDLNEFHAAVDVLKNKFPDLAATHYFNGISLAESGSLDEAAAEFKTAESLGMPHEETERLLTAIEKDKDSRYFGLGNYFYYGFLLVGAWILGLVTLFVAGKILSASTLKSLENSDPNDITGGGQAGLRKLYKNVIGIAGIYYYVSQPIVMMLVLVAAAAIVVFFLYVGTIPIKLLLIVGFVALGSVFYMVKSLFVRVKVEDPGRALSENEAPGLWTLTREVAKSINTRPVDEIRITHGTDLAVYERGGMRVKMQDKAERILIVGVAVLNDFSQNAFRAVLAHEYGHFSNRDTAGGNIAHRVNIDIINLARSMALGGTATFYNLAFQFLRFYHFLFRRITQGASRLQEILADRVAVHQYGAEAFREGLTHVIRRDIEFNHVADREINAALSANRALQNLYEMTEHNEEIKKDLEQQYNEYIARPTTEDDSHPSPEDRFTWAGQIRSREIEPIGGMVWDLFTAREALTKEMSDLLEARLKAMR